MQRQRHHFHAHIGLFLLSLAGIRVRRGGYHIDVARAEQQVFRQVNVIAALANILYCVGIGRRGTALDNHLYCGFLSGAVSTRVLVVISVGKPHATALLHRGMVHRGTEHYLCRAALTATAAAACRYVGTGYLGPALVGQREAHAALVVANLGRHAKHRRGFHLGHLCRHGLVLYRVRAARVQALVHLHLVEVHAHVALCVRLLSHPVHRHALHRTVATEVCPGRSLFPTVKARSHKLLGLPFALGRLVGHAQAFTPLLCFHRGYGRLQCVVAV